ncbi:hypothetical protein TNCV_3067841 [Trichonephila clavipes]|nr:hypothetical protein TNCV_3067841 [Trichonephila clavipes]
MLRKRTNSPFREERKVPAVDPVASTRTGSSGDLLSKVLELELLIDNIVKTSNTTSKNTSNTDSHIRRLNIRFFDRKTVSFWDYFFLGFPA